MTITAAACARPSCTGSLEDGYCNLCGMAAAVAAMPQSSASAGGPAAAGSSVPGGSGRSGTARPVRTASGRTSRIGSAGRSRRGMLGAGLVEIPPVPSRDPAAALMQDPEVAESKRFCGKCGDPVGRNHDGRPGLKEGFCRTCGTGFSFTPKLAAGDLVGGQYEVVGCLAHGGLGWIHLARDRNVNDRWVVLKGLLDSGDADATASAAAERQFLATVEHPNIVKIYNFVQHPDPLSGTSVGYIVMEYVGGRSLKDLLVARRREAGGSLPLAHVIAYGLEALRALDYLHGLGLVYCDFKPDNVIQTEEQIKLIDLGGVRQLDDEDGPIYGTVGYQAPEIATDGPSIASDLYTVGRVLAVLSFEFKGYTTTFKHRLPERDQIPLLARHESFDRLLRRATHHDPGQRFWSAAEMAEQLFGVLREVLAAEDGRSRPALSTRFGPELRVLGTGEAVRPKPPDVAAALPLPLADHSDPAAGYLAGLTATSPVALLARLAAAPASSTEVRLRLARVRTELGQFQRARTLLAGLADDWRADWYLGLTELAAGNSDQARRAFDQVYDLLPGEAAPKLALAYCAEWRGDLPAAARYYELVWRTDQAYVGAAFGLARVRLAMGDRPGGMKVLDDVPAASRHHLAAQVAAITARVGTVPDLQVDDLIEAARRLERLELDAEHRERLTAEVLDAALAWALAAGNAPPPLGTRVFGIELRERALRFGLERAYRRIARLAKGDSARIDLVDRANRVRPRTLT